MPLLKRHVRGTHGRGFAVVADEVRKLAEQTQTSLNGINGNISELGQIVEEVATHSKRELEKVDEIDTISSELLRVNEESVTIGQEVHDVSIEMAEKISDLVKASEKAGSSVTRESVCDIQLIFDVANVKLMHAHEKILFLQSEKPFNSHECPISKWFQKQTTLKNHPAFEKTKEIHENIHRLMSQKKEKLEISREIDTLTPPFFCLTR